MNTPTVSVCVVTYNQEKYIRQCLQSIVDQKTDFDFEVIVGEDCSTDCTRAIVEEFADRYPNVVKPIFHEKNIGGSQNYFSTHGAARGEFIAHVDGDDYCMPGKLQKQKNFLEEHRECAMVFHSMTHIEESEQEVNYEAIELNGDLVVFDVDYLVEAANCSFAHSSKMYRSTAARTKFSRSDMLDFRLNIEHALSGKIGYLNECLGCYRVKIGFSNNINLEYLEFVNDAFDFAETVGVKSIAIVKGRMKFLDQALSRYLSNGTYPQRAVAQHTSQEWLLSPPKLKLFGVLTWIFGHNLAFQLLRRIYLSRQSFCHLYKTQDKH